MKSIKIIVGIGVLLVLSSCASKRRSEGKDVDDIENIDFQKETLVKYNKNEDYYNIWDMEKPINDSLVEETIQRVTASNVKLEKATEDKDEISELASMCYAREFKRAFISIDNLYRRYQKHPGYWNQVGTCYLLRNELRKANLFYKQALKYNKHYAPAYNNIGNIHIRRKEYEKALAAFKKAHELKKNALTPAFNLAQIYLNFGVVNKAQELLLNIENQKGGDSSVWGALATAYLFQGNITKSLSYFERIPAGGQRYPGIGLNYSVALMISGKKEEALRVFKNIKNKNPEWKNYYSRVETFVRKR